MYISSDNLFPRRLSVRRVRIHAGTMLHGFRGISYEMRRYQELPTQSTVTKYENRSATTFMLQIWCGHSTVCSEIRVLARFAKHRRRSTVKICSDAVEAISLCEQISKNQFNCKYVEDNRRGRSHLVGYVICAGFSLIIPNGKSLFMTFHES